MYTDDWKEYSLRALFTISSTKTLSLDRLHAGGPGPYPYVTTQATNNGVAGMYSEYTEEGGVITVDSAVLGTCFYQEKRFSASDHVEKLVPKVPMSREVALFIVTLLNREMYKYSFGRKRSKKILNTESIWLPAKADGNPDWEWMEQFIARLMEEERDRVIRIATPGYK